jgi:regulatory protein
MSFRRRSVADTDKQDDPEAAFNTLLRDLGRRDRTEADARARLRERGFDRDAIDAAIARAIDHSYIDDDRTASRLFASLRDKGWGPSQVRLRLQQQGVDSGRIDALLDETPDERWLERAIARLSRKRLDTTDEDARAKAWRYLQYRGFSSQTIRGALTALADRTDP